MAEKVSSLVITVDLSCCRSFKKIRKTLCKLQESEDIRAILYDDKAGTVTVSGGFDPLVLPCKLRRKAGSVIKDIHLKKERKKHKVPPPPAPAPAPAAREFCNASPGLVCLCRAHCHCGAAAAAGAAPRSTARRSEEGSPVYSSPMTNRLQLAVSCEGLVRW